MALGLGKKDSYVGAMRILVVLAHPSPASFNHAIAREVVTALEADKHTVTLRDLYAEGFDPLLQPGEAARSAALTDQIAAEVAGLATADGVVIIHPNWWGMPPAILTGWVDRVIRVGSAYEFTAGDKGEGVPIGLLPTRSAVIFNTSDTEPQRELTAFGDPLERIWRDCIFGLCGVEGVQRRTFTPVVTSTEAQRSAWLAEAAELARSTFTSRP